MENRQRHLSCNISQLDNKVCKDKAVLSFFNSICSVLSNEKISFEAKDSFKLKNINTNDSLKFHNKDILYNWKNVIDESFLSTNTIIHIDNCLVTENDFKFFVKELIPYFYVFKLQTNFHIFINLYFENEIEKNIWLKNGFGKFFCVDEVPNNFNTFLAIRYENNFDYGSVYDASKKYRVEKFYFNSDDINLPIISDLPAYTNVLDTRYVRSSFFDIKLLEKNCVKNYEDCDSHRYKLTKKTVVFELNFLRAEKFLVTLSLFKKELKKSFNNDIKILIKGSLRFDVSNCNELNKYDDTYFGDNLYLNDFENNEKYNLINESIDTKIFLEKLEKFLDTEFFAFEKFSPINQFL